jgi:hypothetical protein
MLPLINLLPRLLSLKKLDCSPSSLEFSKEEKLSAQCPVGDAS